MQVGGCSSVLSALEESLHPLLAFHPKGGDLTPPEVSPLPDSLDFMVKGVAFSPGVLSTPLALKF